MEDKIRPRSPDATETQNKKVKPNESVTEVLTQEWARCCRLWDSLPEEFCASSTVVKIFVTHPDDEFDNPATRQFCRDWVGVNGLDALTTAAKNCEIVVLCCHCNALKQLILGDGSTDKIGPEQVTQLTQALQSCRLLYLAGCTTESAEFIQHFSRVFPNTILVCTRANTKNSLEEQQDKQLVLKSVTGESRPLFHPQYPPAPLKAFCEGLTTSPFSLSREELLKATQDGVRAMIRTVIEKEFSTATIVTYSDLVSLEDQLKEAGSSDSSLSMTDREADVSTVVAVCHSLNTDKDCDLKAWDGSLITDYNMVDTWNILYGGQKGPESSVPGKGATGPFWVALHQSQPKLLGTGAKVSLPHYWSKCLQVDIDSGMVLLHRRLYRLRNKEPFIAHFERMLAKRAKKEEAKEEEGNRN
eukprot:TRINITY_DN66760_c0_g4_i1.p1 TRINITY_DN66760_c0_g4~~TRINITY_DN66760_c0_g4_i1.p1  ORF type:complete len:415 (+),score=26.39 TRINITY_DN66760_c0_g4_i1:15-1259(+)